MTGGCMQWWAELSREAKTFYFIAGGFVLLILSRSGLDGKSLGRFCKWAARGFRAKPPQSSQEGELAPPKASATSYPRIRTPGERTVIGREADRERLRTILASGWGAQITSAGAVLQGEGGCAPPATPLRTPARITGSGRLSRCAAV